MGIYLPNETLVKTIKNEEEKELVKSYERIAVELLNSRNFRGYSNKVKEKMVETAIVDCLKYGNNFTFSKSKNPFAYYTEIIRKAFVRTINRERKRLYQTFKMIENFPVVFNDEIETLSPENAYRRHMLEEIQDDVTFEVDEAYVQEYISKYENRCH